MPVKIKVPGINATVTTYMGLDPWCTDVYIKPELMTKLGNKNIVSDQMVSLTTMSSKNEVVRTKVLHNIEVTNIEENEMVVLPVVYSACGSWPFDKNDTPQPSDIENYPHLKNLPFNFVDSDIGILLGMKHSDIMMPIKSIRGTNNNEPYATLHKFGWALNKGAPSLQDNGKCFRTHTKDLDRQEVCHHEFIDPFPCQMKNSVEDKELVKNSLDKNDTGLFEVSLPVKKEKSLLPDIRAQVDAELVSLKKMQNNSDCYNEYCEKLE